MSSLGEPEKLRGDSLPTEHQIYNHFLYLIDENSTNGEWTKTTSFPVKVRAVLSDIKRIWDKTSIPHILNDRLGEKKLTSLLTKCKNLTKLPKKRREDGFGCVLDQLFDVAYCQHRGENVCTCDLSSKVIFNF